MMKDGGNTFFRILRFSISTDEQFDIDLSEDDWIEIYTIAQRQSLLGILFNGIQKLSKAKPERKLLLRWYAISEQIKKRNMMMNSVVADVQDFFIQNGFRSCLLKGQGNALYYPDPSIRTNGDIDIWVKPGDGKKNGAENECRKVLRFARENFSCSKAIYHHVDAGKYKGVEIEIHYRPAFLNNLIHNWRLQKWFEENAGKQFTHRVLLANTDRKDGTVCVPTVEFNMVYQLSHIYHHIIHEGIGLRQLMDYYYLLKSDERDLQEDMAKTLQFLGLYKIATAMMWVLKEKLGLEERYLIVPPNERLGRFLLNEIMQGGNFGQYDSRVKHTASQLSQNIQLLQRDFRLMWYFPSECLWEPIFRIYHFLWRVAHK